MFRYKALSQSIFLQKRAFSALNLSIARRSHADLEKIRNIGIAAHIDSGKTTVSERILYYSGRISDIHEVRGKDKVGATMDSMELEKERGITIQSAATTFDWEGHNFNLIDTPGHVDFTVEVERSLRVLDGAVLVVCAVGGIQSQTLTVHRQMKRYDIPVIAFINKLDRMGADPVKCLSGIRDRLLRTSAFLQLPIGLEKDCKGLVDLIEETACYFKGDKGEDRVYGEVPEDMKANVEKYRQDLIETIADVDEELGEMFLMEEEITKEHLYAGIRRATIARTFTPIMMGTAIKNLGIQSVMDMAIKILPNPGEVKNFANLENKQGEAEKLEMDPSIVEIEEMSKRAAIGLAFKLDTTAYGQLTYVRMYQGVFKRGDPIYNTRTGQKVRIAKMCKMHADKMEPCETVQAGDIAAFFGVDCASGDTFINQRAMSAGLKKVAMESIYVPDPVVKLSIEPKKKSSKDLETFNKALTRFGKEDPTFVVEFNADTGEKTISGMGELHLEIYAQRMEREYDCPVTLGRPTVVFYETLLDEAQFNYLHKKQTGGRGQYGQAEGFVKPTFDADEGGMKVSFTDATAGNELSKNYVGPIEKGMRSMLESGPTAGKPVIGFHMELEAGKQHENDSSDFAFFNCGVGCMEQIFSKVPTKVLGPVMKVEVAIPNQFQNQVVHMISGRHGQINEQEETYDYTTYDCRVQLYDMFGFTADLRQCTEGKGEFTMEFEKYDFARDEIENTLQNEFEQAKIDAANLAKKPQSSKKKK